MSYLSVRNKKENYPILDYFYKDLKLSKIVDPCHRFFSSKLGDIKEDSKIFIEDLKDNLFEVSTLLFAIILIIYLKTNYLTAEIRTIHDLHRDLQDNLPSHKVDPKIINVKYKKSFSKKQDILKIPIRIFSIFFLIFEPVFSKFYKIIVTTVGTSFGILLFFINMLTRVTHDEVKVNDTTFFLKDTSLKLANSSFFLNLFQEQEPVYKTETDSTIGLNQFLDYKIKLTLVRYLLLEIIIEFFSEICFNKFFRNTKRKFKDKFLFILLMPFIYNLAIITMNKVLTHRLLSSFPTNGKDNENYFNSYFFNEDLIKKICSYQFFFLFTVLLILLVIQETGGKEGVSLKESICQFYEDKLKKPCPKDKEGFLFIVVSSLLGVTTLLLNEYISKSNRNSSLVKATPRLPYDHLKTNIESTNNIAKSYFFRIVPILSRNLLSEVSENWFNNSTLLGHIISTFFEAVLRFNYCSPQKSGKIGYRDENKVLINCLFGEFNKAGQKNINDFNPDVELFTDLVINIAETSTLSCLEYSFNKKIEKKEPSYRIPNLATRLCLLPCVFQVALLFINSLKKKKPEEDNKEEKKQIQNTGDKNTD